MFQECWKRTFFTFAVRFVWALSDLAFFSIVFDFLLWRKCFLVMRMEPIPSPICELQNCFKSSGPCLATARAPFSLHGLLLRAIWIILQIDCIPNLKWMKEEQHNKAKSSHVCRGVVTVLSSEFPQIINNNKFAPQYFFTSMRKGKIQMMNIIIPKQVKARENILLLDDIARWTRLLLHHALEAILWEILESIPIVASPLVFVLFCPDTGNTVNNT